jgi:RNA polymerase sigma-70 factor (ECF subfamily)
MADVTPFPSPSSDFGPEEQADIVLMERIATGDEAALAALIERWKTPLVNFFYRSLRSYESAEDLAQTVFIRIFRAAPKYQPTAKFSTYLFHIARRLLINEFRRQQRKPLDPTDPTELRAVDENQSEREVREIEEAFELAVTELPENQRTAILLLKQQQLSYQEIAEIMDSSESAVKTWIFRARQFLKQALKDLV